MDATAAVAAAPTLSSILVPAILSGGTAGVIVSAVVAFFDLRLRARQAANETTAHYERALFDHRLETYPVLQEAVALWVDAMRNRLDGASDDPIDPDCLQQLRSTDDAWFPDVGNALRRAQLFFGIPELLAQGTVLNTHVMLLRGQPLSPSDLEALDAPLFFTGTAPHPLTQSDADTLLWSCGSTLQWSLHNALSLDDLDLSLVQKIRRAAPSPRAVG
jgi:hypothetical protein